MCLILKDDILYTADKDITVYKSLDKDNYSVFFYFPYTPFKTYFLNKPLEIRWWADVNEGFHAYLTYREMYKRWYLGEKIVEFIIPEGAKYYLGVNGDIVSDTIRAGDLSWTKTILRKILSTITGE